MSSRIGDAAIEIDVWSAQLKIERRIRRLAKLAWILPALFALLAPIGWMSGDPQVLGVLMAMMLATVLWASMTVLPFGATWLLARREATPSRARLDADGLRVGSIHLPLASLAMAWLRGPHQVEVLTHEGDELSLELRDPAAALAFVDAVRRATDGRRAYPVALESTNARVWRSIWAWLAPVTVGTFVAMAGPAYLPAIAVGGALGWLGARGTRRLRFGADGVAFEGRFRRRYVAYRDVARVSVRTGALGAASVRLHLTDGTSLGLGVRMDGPRAQLVRALIEEGIQMCGAGEAAGAHVAALERAGEHADEWRERLAGTANERGYRGVALDAERLLSLMRNPAASREQRVAAALALRTAPGGPARIRVAADVSAEPEVRAAFEELAEEELDEARLGKAFARLDRAS